MGNGRITLGLYNSYDPSKFREPHRRALARAGGLALAFDMNLALFGFPIPEEAATPRETAEWVAGTTSIGGGGDYFIQLAEKGRFMKFPYPAKGFPPQLGEPILTTSKPVPSKSITLRQAADMVVGGKSILLVFGLGPHGVPKGASAIPAYNLDATGGGFSLETCTAIGAVAGALHSLIGQ
ncbi:MAG: DUF531 domain-containing protein [Candidatus Methanoplasma sp.]|jgi:hypothetical protein|nr:DUF531 domain-containing protein [Candidatus Methanoplasma sp.]